MATPTPICNPTAERRLQRAKPPGLPSKKQAQKIVLLLFYREVLGVGFS
jgi:hypothetical protein